MKSVNEAYLALIVGTSLLRNAINSKSLRDETKDIINKSLNQDPEADARLRAAALNGRILDEISNIVCSDPRMSAEMSTAIAVKRWADRSIDIDLFSTDTGASILAANALAKCINMRGTDMKVTGIVVTPIFSSISFNDALGKFLNIMGKRIITRRGISVIGVTGGLKLEVVAATIIAMLTNARVAYLMESGELVIFPAIPIKLSESLLKMERRKEEWEELVKNGLAEYRDGEYSLMKWVMNLLNITTQSDTY
jgi:CRISPR/Cas system-associated protein Csm6